MARHNLEITVTTSAQNLQEVNEELSRLKIVIGALVAKLGPHERDAFINDLQGFGFNEAADLYSKFNPKE